jgi:hypothetical protein
MLDTVWAGSRGTVPTTAARPPNDFDGNIDDFFQERHMSTSRIATQMSVRRRERSNF